MRTFLLKSLVILAAVAAVPFLMKDGAKADDYPLKPLFLQPNPCSGWEYGGHLEAGIYGNAHGQKNAYSPTTGNFLDLSGNTDYLQNVRQTDLQVNQVWFYLEKKLNTRCGWDIGGRVDYLFGTDARLAQSPGLEISTSNGSRWGTGDYGSALPQAYLEVGYGNISVKAGKFLSPVGQESLVSPDRFFYSLDQTFGYVPATASGVLVNWDVSDKFSLFGGWIQRDQFFNNADDNAFTGGFEYQLSQKSTFGYGLVAGSDNRNDIDYFNHSLYFKHRFNNHWSYALEWALLNDQYEYSGISQNVGANVLSQSLYYQINQKWSTGFRVEWQHQYYGFGDGVDAYSLTYGVNWKPRHWILVRPEIRYDSVDGVDAFKWTKNFPPDPKSDQFAGGVSTVLKF